MRRRYITHPRFQYSFTLSFVLGVLVILLLIAGAAMGTLQLLGHHPMLTPDQRALIQVGSKSLLTSLTIIGLPMIFLFGFVGFILSYRFVGPLYRLEGWLEMQLLGQDPNPIRLRPGDELEDTSKALNHIVGSAKMKRK